MDTINKGKKAGSKAGNQYGTFKVKFCSPSQGKFIERLLNERVHEFNITNPYQVNIKHASRIIEQLLACPKKLELIPPISEKQISFIDLLFKTRQGADYETYNYLRNSKLKSIHELNKDQASDLITKLQSLPKIVLEPAEVGAYNFNGEIISVRKGRQSGNTHAFRFNHETKQWEFARGVVYQIRPEMKLTLSQASQFGVLTGTCVHCGVTLTQRKSVIAGMGRVCASKYSD